MKKFWQLAGKSKERSFVAIAQQGTVMKGETASFEVNGKRVAIARLGEEYYGFSDICTHRQCELSKGYLKSTTIVCPCHGSEFDITSGQVLKGPAAKPLTTYEVRIQEGSIQIST